ncbi:DUF2975 domain-containing protein [Adhaeribacter terreus]|uniref:DUF2975 domain-containing protein n=1 Tax=Adhaeribacter terreus TaxID=529703 RepID=A0ABW0EEC9_9BACT
MERNKLLFWVTACCRIMQVVQIGLIILLTYYVVNWHIDPQYYDDWKFSGSLGKLSISNPIHTAASEMDTTRTFMVSQLQPFSVYMIYIQILMQMVLWILVVQEFVKVIQAVKRVQTFREQNVKSFQKIAGYLLWIFIISGFTFVAAGNTGHFSFDFSFTTLVLMLASYILAEIFKEGNRLYEEEQLTV